MSLVLDASVTLAWVLGEEPVDAVGAVFRDVAAHGAVVPTQWRLEVGNTLTLSVKHGRITAAERASDVADLEALPIEADPETEVRAWSATFAVADRHRLTLYDATYLELAQRRRVPLASLDKKLIVAARAEGVEVRP